ncbi:MAG: type III pantothenate kinase [Crocinitomix sp.]|nr:type III pantothenate kinase [Crocinitomix sp.]
MNLIVDQGNTATKLALFDEGGNLQLKEIIAKKETEFIDQWILEYAKGAKRVLVSSVTNDQINIPISRRIDLDTATPLPIGNAYETPETLGKDRLANAVAIWTKNPEKHSLCIDIGTCIKYDLVNNKGVYLGGNISPGMNMRYAALESFTDQLSLIASEEFVFGFGTTTKTSILNGVQHAIFHEINGFIERYQEQFGELTIFMTGGDLKYFDKGNKNPIFADSDLTIFGLNEILKYNVEY